MPEKVYCPDCGNELEEMPLLDDFDSNGKDIITKPVLVCHKCKLIREKGLA